LGELQDCHFAAGPGHSYHFRQAAIRICHITQTKGDSGDLKFPIGERKLLSVGFQKADALVGPAPTRFLSGSNQHGMAKVRTDDGHAPARGSIVSQGQVPGAGAQIQNRRHTLRRHQPSRPPAPIAIHIQAQQMIEQIIPRRNVAEHSPDASFCFI
jgi:hypothetical protein